MSNKYLNLEGLTTFLNNLRDTFSDADHSHKLEDITDYVVDSTLSSTSTNPVQNQALKSKFDSVESAIASKANASDLTSGNITVKEAEHADSATTATTATTATNANHAASADTATSATSADSATKATQDASGNVITETYETVANAQAKLDSAKAYADSAAATVKNDLLNGAGTAYDTLKELGDLIDDNTDAISALESVASGKADAGHTHDDRYYTESEIDNKISTINSSISGKANATHTHAISDVTNLQSTLDSKASSSHTHNYAGSSTSGGVANSAAKLETARTINLTGDAAGAVDFDGSGDASISTSVTSMHGVTTAGDGAAYTATVSGITSLAAGVSFIMIPHTNSTTTTPTLNVNGLGAKGLRMRGSSATGTAMSAAVTAWLASGRPVQLTYNGVYWLAEVTRPAATDLSGTVAIANGGTGATDAATALTNLGAAAVDHTHSEYASANALTALQSQVDELAASVVTVHSGDSTPLSTIGEDGDIYLVTE